MTRAARDDAALFAPFAAARAILVAVSGGPDSLALLWLSTQWAQAFGGPRIEAATVDHGFRPEARAEAQMVASVAAKLGAPHHILDWTGPRPTTRIQERARDARYELLGACAARIGADVLLTAHHADDQAETILFRLQRGSGVAGLAGMAPISRRGGLTHARPLLDMTKAELIAVCQDAGLDFVTDPSNADPQFARTGLRRLMGVLEAEGLGRAQLLRLGRRAARAEEALAEFTRQTLMAAGAKASEGGLRIQLDTLRATPVEVLLRILMVEIERIGSAGRKPRLDRAEALAERLSQALRTRTALRATLGGALVRLDARGVLTLGLEGARRVNCSRDVHVNDELSASAKETTGSSLGKGPYEA